MKSRKNARAALQRLLKRVKNFSEQNDIPVVMMTMVKGAFLVEGSEGLKGAAFGQNRNVRDSFIRATQIVDPEEPVKERNFQADLMEETLRQLPNISVPILRCVIANAMSPSGRQGRRSVYLGDRPNWWPDHVPFNSPNHPNGRTRALGRKDLLEIGYSLAQHIGIDVMGDANDEYQCHEEQPEELPAEEEDACDEEHHEVLPAEEVLGLLRTLEATSSQGGWEAFRQVVSQLPDVMLPARGNINSTSDVNCAMDTRFLSSQYYLDGVRLFPMICTGNGNCLFNACSIISHGSEDYNLHLRLATIKAAVDSIDDIVRVLHRDHPAPADAFAYATEVLNDTDVLPDPAQEPVTSLLHTVKLGIMSTAKNYAYSGMLQVSLLANALGCPLKVFMENGLELVARVGGATEEPSFGVLWCKASENSDQISHFEPMLPLFDDTGNING